MRIPRLLVVAALAAASVSVPAAASADSRAKTQNCTVSVIGQREDGEFILGEETCFTTLGGALKSVGVKVPSDITGPELAAAGPVTSASTYIIGIHYDGANFTGTSLTVSGSDCAGGWLNLSTYWVNRISSTLNGCGSIRHYQGYFQTGLIETTYYPGGNLSSMNNQANSISYHT